MDSSSTEHRTVARDPDDPEQFAAQARATGLVLPTPREASPWLSLLIIGVVVASAVGVGALTGWMDLRVATGTALPLYGPANCGSTPVVLSGSVAPELGSSFSTWLSMEGSRISAQTGGCAHVTLASSTGDGFVPDLSQRTADFVATAGNATSGEATALSALVLVYPVALNPVAVVYHVPGVASGLRLNGSILAGIYSGAITSWDSSSIVDLNPATNLSTAPPITVLYEPAASVTNLGFTTFLADSSRTWNTTVGSGSTVHWPVGTAVNSSTEMADQLGAVPGAIGYAELFNGSGVNLDTAQLENPHGAFTTPDAPATTAAAVAEENTSAVAHQAWSNLSLINAPGTASYPIVQLSYLALYHDLGTAYGGVLTSTNASWLMTFLWWISQSPSFAPLPSPFLAGVESTLTNVTYNGTPILQVQDAEGGENGSETGEF